MKVISPNFFCIGAQKAGTTTLHDILKQHPEIFLPKRKEAHFFDLSDNYSNGIEWYYKRFFNNYSQEKMVGSCTPEYLFFPNTPHRIKKDLGSEVKFIVILRNPIERAISHFNMSKSRGYETYDFPEAINFENIRINKNEFSLNHFSYINRGLYSIQLKRYFSIFDIKNFLILNFEEDFIKNREETIQQILSFLQVKKLNLKINIKSNESFHYKNKIAQNLRYNKPKFLKKIFQFIPENMRFVFNKKVHQLFSEPNYNKFNLSKTEKQILQQRYFYNDIKELESLTNKDFSNWL
ncbi:sulfotransferase [uncultured Draconibacterium sp.]|uniref:sulfotransferase family protein n=1 Tax=uncultured Draconibacterium sp. TaxID=1573823 RepID=UPI003216CC96